MNVLDRTYDLIDIGRSDAITAIPTGLPKVDSFIYGTRQGTYYLYGAESGVGKTTYVREKHMHAVYEYVKTINDPSKVDVLFLDFSLEITAENNMAAAIARKIYLDHQKILPVAQIFGWSKDRYGKLSDEAVKLIKSYDNYFREFQRKLVVIDEETTPTLFHDVLFEAAKRHGKFSKEARWVSESGVYTPNNPNLYVICIVDTINLADIEIGNQSIKNSIDRISRVSVWFRNKCNFIPIIIQQFNADISDIDRTRFGVTTPMLRDFEDSKRTTKDANIVFGLYDPQRKMRDESMKFQGYDIGILRSWFRSLHLLKNRNSEPNKVVPLKFSGAVGIFTELPPAREMTQEDYLKATKY